MKIATEKTENSQIIIEVEMDPEEVEKSLEDAYKRVVKKVNIPGFRKGKAPRQILERHVGRGALMEEAIEYMIPEACYKAIEENNIDAISQPHIDLVSIEPVKFKATVPIRPTVKLGDYQSIRVEPEPVEITEEQVEQVVEQLREQHGTWIPVERPVQFGDIVNMSIEGSVGEKELVNEKNAPYRVMKGFTMPLPGFPEKLEGIVVDEERTFALPFPDDYPADEFKGKECSFKVKATDIKEQQLPDADDDFAKNLGVDCDTLEALRERIRDDLRKRAEAEEKNRFEDRVVQMVVENAEVEYPPVLLEAEINKMLMQQEEQMQQRGQKLEEYIKSSGKSVEELKKELAPTANQRVLRGLVMGKLADVETINVTSEEIEAEVDKLSKDAGEKAEGIKKFFELQSAREPLENAILSRKVLGFLTDIAKGPQITAESETEVVPVEGPKNSNDINA